jgi:membrane protease YdiL (CAAX protease family)
MWLTALLFGLAHGLSLDKDWSLMMNRTYFGSSFSPGWLFGWMTVRSGSILASTLAHNLANST